LFAKAVQNKLLFSI